MQPAPSGEKPDGHAWDAGAVRVRVRFSHQHCSPANGSKLHTFLRYVSVLVHTGGTVAVLSA